MEETRFFNKGRSENLTGKFHYQNLGVEVLEWFL